MQKLLTASLLLAGCAFQPALAQQAASTLAKTTATGPTQPLTQVPDWVAAEFSEAYGRYFNELPAFYRYTVSQALRSTGLVTPNGDFASALMQNTALRETIYQAIYQYCHALKYGLGSKPDVNELVYQLLYEDFHLSDLAATRLAPYINSRYKQPAPLPQYSASSVDGDTPRPLTTGSLNRYPAEKPGSGGLDLDGWRFDDPAAIEKIDDESGSVRFQIKVSDTGRIETVSKRTGNVSPAQEKACRDMLLNTRLVKTSPYARATTGYYTFRLTVK